MNIAPVSSSSSSERPAHDARIFPSDHLLLFALVTALFFIWGMSNNLTDILVQQFKKSFVLTPLAAQLVQTAVFFGYFCMALPAALLMQRRGYKAGIVTGLCLFGTGTLFFWPAAVVAKYPMMLIALYLVGCGSAMLETAANPFIAQFGSPETAERRLNFSQVFNPLGTIIGVLIGTRFIFSGIELSPAQTAQMQAQGTYGAYLHSEIMRVVPTYVTLGCVVLLLAFAIYRSKFPVIASEADSMTEGKLWPQIAALLATPSLRAAIVAQFCYCGAQVATWSAFIPYMKQYTQSSERVAALFLTAHLIALLLGRIVSTSLMNRFSASRMMSLYAFINIALVGIGVALPGRVGVGALLASSFCMSIMFPTIFATGVRGLGSRTKLGGSLIVMAVVGAAVVPALLGLIAKHTGSYAAAYLIVAACYLPVALYGLRAHRESRIDAVPSVI